MKKSGLLVACATGWFTAMLLLGSCDRKAPEVVKPGAEKPLSAAEVQGQINAVLFPVHEMVAKATTDSVVDPAWMPQLKVPLDEIRKKLGTSNAYKEGAHGAVKSLEDDLRIAREAQNAGLVLMLCDLVRYFEPKNARLPRFEKWASMVKNRPVVTIRGWYEPRDTTVRIIYVFLEIYTPEDGQTHHIQACEGEEFYNLRFEKIIGDKRGIRFEYAVSGDQFEVYTRSWQRQE